MKILLLLLLLLNIIIFINSRMTRPVNDCVDWGCTCADPGMRFFAAPTCPNKATANCYATLSKCTRQAGQCGYKDSLSLRQCLKRAGAGGLGTVEKKCTIGGCSGEICTEYTGEAVAGICIWREEFACYKNYNAVCAVQATGECGWTMTPELDRCLNSSHTDPVYYVDPIPVSSNDPAVSALSRNP
jgi:hypothetical protein